MGITAKKKKMEGEGYSIEGVLEMNLWLFGGFLQKDQFKKGAWNAVLVILSIYIALILILYAWSQ